MSRVALLVVVLPLAACGPRSLEPDAPYECERCDGWNEPIDPYRVHGNTWYVGTDGLSSLLIETSDGLVLVDGGLPQSAVLIDANIRKLGFDTLDIRAILISHAHFDHAGGINALQRMTRAPVYTSSAAAETLTGGRLQAGDPQYVAGTDNGRFPAVHDVVTVADGEEVTVGELSVRAVYTPGHTAGGVTWTWESCGAALQMVESAGIIAELDCDILLSPHPFFFGMYDKLERMDEGNPFVNELGCTFYAEEALGWLEQRLAAEKR
jgi:metallo-beta-lactamase class B